MTTDKPAPVGWNKTIDDLCREVDSGLRKVVGDPEISWAWNYERSLLPKNTRFPKGGDIYEALEDIELKYLETYMAPFSSGGKGILLRGEKISAEENPFDAEPVAVYAKPIDSEGIEKRLLADSIRNNSKFSGLIFCVETHCLNTKFRLVESEGK